MSGLGNGQLPKIEWSECNDFTDFDTASDSIAMGRLVTFKFFFPYRKGFSSPCKTPILPLQPKFLLAFVVSFLTPVEQMSEDPAVQRLFKNLPLWYHVVFGVAVIAGTLGCVGLLMRARWALPVLVVSILGVVAQQSYMYFMSDTLEVMGGSAAIMPTMVLVIGIVLIGFSKLATGKGWLR